jgi:hypothetical protein
VKKQFTAEDLAEVRTAYVSREAELKGQSQPEKGDAWEGDEAA